MEKNVKINWQMQNEEVQSLCVKKNFRKKNVMKK